MKKMKKKIIPIVAALSATAVAATSFTVLFYDVDNPTPLDMYITKFDSSVPDYQAKNALIQSSMDKVTEILDEYEAETGNSAELTLQYANLHQIQTQGEKNYWYSLDRALKAIDPRLGFYNQQRTPALVQRAFHNKNTEMMSFYWSPDYNNIGTWIKYMFTDTYTVPNMWPMVYAELHDTDTADDPMKEWETSLKTELDKHALGKSGPNPLSADSSPMEAVNWIASKDNVNNNTLDDFYTLVSNVIASWMSNNSSMDITRTEEEIKVPTTNETVLQKKTKYDGAIPVGLQFMNYLASMNPNIPYQEVGPHTNIPTLMSDGLYMPINPNADFNLRDFYCYPDTYKSSFACDWIPANPFQNNDTPWNPCFSKVSNTLIGQSVFVGLTSWTAVGDANDPNFVRDKNGKGAMEIFLVGDGAKDNIQDDAVKAKMADEYAKKTLTFKIRPIPWVNGSGDKTGYLLSPEDFAAGFKAFKRSVDCGINVNNAYFITLLGVDFDKTLNDPNNWLRNESSMDEKEFKIYFDDPILSFTDALDILQKQYFMAIPAKHPKVQNIIDDKLFDSIAKPSSHNMDLSQTDLSKFYGLGDGIQQSVWGDLWYASPYYLSKVDQQKISFKLNKHYFEAFTDETAEYYKSFKLDATTDYGKNYKKLENIDIKYAGSYNQDIIFEQFKSGEINKAAVEGANFSKAVDTMKDKLRYIPTVKNNKSNVAGFNLQVYEKWNEPKNQVPAGYHAATGIIVDTNDEPMWDPTTRRVLYKMDEFGNWDFNTPELKGRKPKLKSAISDAYYQLIVKDFYTPKLYHRDGKVFHGTSQTLRFAMMNCINWVSLASLVTPGVTYAVQYSFIPFGVYTIHNTKGEHEPEGEYWDFAAYKQYMTKEQLDVLNPKNLDLRLSGNCIWTYNELLEAMIKR